jgi:general secretion pathway protein F
MIGLALWYPLIVFSLAFILFTFLVIQIIPRFRETFESLQLPVHSTVTTLSWVGSKARFWWPILPVVLGSVVVWWIRSGRAAGLRSGRARSSMRLFPWMGAMLANFEAANFADLLALLLEHNVPLPGAIMLCADASDDPALVASCRTLVTELEQGSIPGDALRGSHSLPPLLRWLLSAGTQAGDLIGALRQMATFYRRKALYQAEKGRVLLPTLLLCAIGLSATLFYAVTLFVPFSTLLKEIGQG